MDSKNTRYSKILGGVFIPDHIDPWLLSAAAERDSRFYFGASDAPTIMGNDYEAKLRLWRQKTGKEPTHYLDDNIAVEIGRATEKSNIYRLIKTLKKKGKPILLEDVLFNRVIRPIPPYNWLRSSPDGIVDDDSKGIFLIEAKHVNERTLNNNLIDKYYPQVQHQMLTTNIPNNVFFFNSVQDLIRPMDEACLCAYIGTQRWVWFSIKLNLNYMRGLFIKTAEFAWAVYTKTEPPMF